MSLFKFQDSNFLNGYNRPDVVATVDTYNGYQFTITDGTAVALADATAAKLGDGYVMWNIIDKPEIINTDSYKVVDGEYIRAFRLKDFVGQRVEMSADLVTDAFAGVAKDDTLVARATDDTTNTMKWKKAADVSAYTIYLKVIAKTTFGAFTVDADGGTVKGGYTCEICQHVPV